MLNSIRFWGELHIVMTNDRYDDGHLEQPDGLAVLGFFVDVSYSMLYINVLTNFKNRGKELRALSQILQELGPVAVKESTKVSDLSLQSLIGSELSQFHRYE